RGVKRSSGAGASLQLEHWFNRTYGPDTRLRGVQMLHHRLCAASQHVPQFVALGERVPDFGEEGRVLCPLDEACPTVSDLPHHDIEGCAQTANLVRSLRGDLPLIVAGGDCLG